MNRVRDAMGALALAILFVFVRPASGSTKLTLYEQGLKDAYAGDYNTAISLLKASYTSKPSALTAYVLSICFSQTRDYDDARDFALEALEAKPPLPKKYAEDAKTLLVWSIAAPQSIGSSATTTSTLSVHNAGTTDVDLQRGLAASAKANPGSHAQSYLTPRAAKFVTDHQVRTQMLIMRASSPCGSPGGTNSLAQCIYWRPSPPMAPLPVRAKSNPAQ